MSDSLESEQETSDIDVQGLSDEELDQALGNATLEAEGDHSSTDVDEPAVDEKPDEESEEDKQVLSPEIAAQLKELEGLRALKSRQDQELGELRKMKEQALLKQQEELANKEKPDFWEDPDKAAEQKVIDTLHKIETQKQQLLLQQEQQRRERQTLLEQLAPDYKDYLGDASDILKETLGKFLPNADKVAESFKNNPYNETPQEVLAFTLAAKYRREAMEAKEALKARGNEAGSLISKISKFSNNKLVGNSPKTSKQTKVPTLSERDIHGLSDKELDELLKTG